VENCCWICTVDFGENPSLEFCQDQSWCLGGTPARYRCACRCTGSDLLHSHPCPRRQCEQRQGTLPRVILTDEGAKNLERFRRK
jgi:hypothetical protein